MNTFYKNKKMNNLNNFKTVAVIVAQILEMYFKTM